VAAHRKVGAIDLQDDPRAGDRFVMMSSPARSWSRIARIVASSNACSRHSGSTRHSSVARTRGGKRPASLTLSISQSGWV
jgi:hypothetical protein